MAKIIIAGTAKLYKEMIEFKEELESEGNIVLNYPKDIDEDTEYKETFETFYNDLEYGNIDKLILYNLDKNGIKGYIGYESFAEMSYVIVNNIIKKQNVEVYIYQMPSEECGCYDEIKQFLKLGYIKLYDKKNN